MDEIRCIVYEILQNTQAVNLKSTRMTGQLLNSRAIFKKIKLLADAQNNYK